MSVPARTWTATPSDVNGGQTATSMPSKSASRRLSSTQNSAVSTTPLNIFQLPAISTLFLRDDCYSRQFFPFQELEGSPTPGRGPIDLVDEPHLGQCANRIGAADDRVRVGARDRFRDGLRPLGEARPLEDAHRAVPEHGLRAGDGSGEGAARLGSDVEAQPAVGQIVVAVPLRLGIL